MRSQSSKTSSDWFGSNSVLTLGVLFILVAFGVWFGLNLRGALIIDETVYALTGLGLLTGNPYMNPTHMFAPTGKYFIGAGQLLFGKGALGARLPIALLSLATIYVTYRLGCHLFDRKTGLLGSGLTGISHMFAAHSTMAMLDIPLTLFFILGFYVSLRWIEEGTNWLGYTTGALTAATATAKAYGFVYALTIAIGVAIYVLYRSDIRNALRELIYPIVGGVGFLTIAWLPFILIPHPPVQGNRGQLVETILSIPIFGDIAYTFGAAISINISHLGRGHTVEIGSTVYQYPPLWSYIYWTYSRFGFVFLLGLIIMVLVALKKISTRKSIQELSFEWVVLIPLLVLSLMTVKFPRYIIPLLPLLSLGVVWHVSSSLRSFINRNLGPSSARVKRLTPYSMSILLIIGLMLVPPSPLVETASTPIKTDSGSDEIANFVETYAEDHPSEEITVLAVHPQTITYYLAPNDRISFVELPTYALGNEAEFNELHHRHDEGEFDLVVLFENSAGFRQAYPEFYHSLVDDHEPRFSARKSPNGELVVVYEL